MASKLMIKKEITLLHLLMLLTSKLFIGISIGLAFSDFALPYSYVLFIFGFLLLLPNISFLFKEQRIIEKNLKKRLKKKKR